MQSALKQISPLFPLAILLLLTTNIHAQPATPEMPAPPPMRFVSRDDRSQLDLARDPKARVHLTIDLTEAHLAHMEELTAHKMFDQASAVLGTYIGLIEDAMHYIGTLPPDKNTTRDLYRRLEIALRAQLPRLAVMRRDTPLEYSIHLKTAEDFVRDTRSVALDSFYGHTVMREPATPVKKEDARNASSENKRP